MSDDGSPDLGETADGPRHGLEAVENSESNGGGAGFLPFNPRTESPRDVARQVRAWVAQSKFVILAFSAVSAALVYFLDVSPPELPPWADVAAPAALVAVGLGAWVGLRVGEFFAVPEFKIISQLDPADGDQELIKISIKRWQSLEVYSRDGRSVSKQYLEEVVINGRRGIEVDRYWPDENACVASHMAGRSNRDIRADENAINRIKSELEAEANEAVEAKVNVEERARKQAGAVSNALLATYEGVASIGEIDLEEQLNELDRDDDDGRGNSDLLDDLENDLFGVDNHANGDGDGDVEGLDGEAGETLENAVSRVRETVRRNNDGGDE